MADNCKHFNNFEPIRTDIYECKKCVDSGDSWVHLRLCQSCGQVHCCDSSKNKHGTKHYKESGHPIITSAEPGENWAYCYVDELYED